jgi:hypothetical protein
MKKSLQFFAISMLLAMAACTKGTPAVEPVASPNETMRFYGVALPDATRAAKNGTLY